MDAGVCYLAGCMKKKHRGYPTLERLLGDSGMGPGDLAKFLGRTPAVGTNILNGDRKLSAEEAHKLAQHFGVTIDELLGNVSMLQIPVLGYVGAGGEISPVDDIPILSTNSMREIDWDQVNCETLEVPASLYPPGTGAVKVMGESMYPVFWDGDYILYQRAPLKPSELLDEECIVMLEEGRCLVKILQKGETFGTFNLISYNAPPIKNVRVAWAALAGTRIRKPKRLVKSLPI